jgi:hypothetical protein
MNYGRFESCSKIIFCKVVFIEDNSLSILLKGIVQPFELGGVTIGSFDPQ